MKNFTLLLSFVLIASISYAQKIKVTDSFVPYSNEQKVLAVQKDHKLKSEGEVFFKETFDWKDDSNPKGWTLPEGWLIVDENNLGHNWTWRAGSDSIQGWYTFLPGHIYSKTPEDGYFVLPIDEYNSVDGVYATNAGFAWFQLPELDCSTRPGVILSLSQYFRCCCGAPDVKCLVSNDLGVHWASFNLQFGTKTNIFCKNPYPEVNISEVAAGMSKVWIRFQWNTNHRYFWCIDDIQLMESFKNELQLENTWLYMADNSAEDNDEGFVYMIPFSQVGVNNWGSYTFKGALLNAGLDDQEGCKISAEVFKNGISVYNQTSAARDIWSLQRDTFPITTPFIPDDYGNYKMVLTARQDQTDGVPSNNLYSDTFYVTDSVYSISDWEPETYSSTAGIVGGNNDGDYLGVVTDISKACEANSISALIMQRKDNPRASTQVGYGFQFWIFKWDDTEAAWIEIISSDFGDITQEMLNTWVTLPLMKDGESEFLEPGYYITAIQGFHGGGASPDNNVYRFTIGSDQSHNYSDGKTVFRMITGEDWSGNSDLSMIRLNLNNAGAPATADVQFNVDMTLPITNGYFNPGSDFVDLAGTFNNWSGSEHLTDGDGDGIYSITLPGLAIFQKIEYKYRINGNWNTSEFPSGGPNRVYRTTYYNMLHDVYNNGISMGVDLNTINSSVKVYPNPSDGAFTLNVTPDRISDLNITVTNLQGQTVYNKQVKAAVSYSETIDLTRYAKGMYFLKVNDQVIKLMIK